MVFSMSVYMRWWRNRVSGEVGWSCLTFTTAHKQPTTRCLSTGQFYCKLFLFSSIKRHVLEWVWCQISAFSTGSFKGTLKCCNWRIKFAESYCYYCEMSLDWKFTQYSKLCAKNEIKKACCWSKEVGNHHCRPASFQQIRFFLILFF